MSKQLVVGEDYISVFICAETKSTMIYNGGINFTATNDKGESRTLDSQGTYDKVLAQLNKPAIMMGRM